MCRITDIPDQIKSRQESVLIKILPTACTKKVSRAKTMQAKQTQGLCNYPAKVEISDKNRDLTENVSIKMKPHFF